MNSDVSRITPQILSGWKEIANYLGKGVRTVQRYEWELQLPVRRPAGKPRGSVIATREELEAWVAASPIRDGYQLKSGGSGAQNSQAHAIRDGIAEMHRLREQTLALRAELHTSVCMLQRMISRSLVEISGNLADDTRTKLPRGLKLLEQDSVDKPVLSLEGLPANRKAS
jgi:hypothetical protein